MRLDRNYFKVAHYHLLLAIATSRLAGSPGPATFTHNDGDAACDHALNAVRSEQLCYRCDRRVARSVSLSPISLDFVDENRRLPVMGGLLIGVGPAQEVAVLPRSGCELQAER